MLLSLDTRGVGRVTVVRCRGRIVAGSEMESLRSHITAMLLEHKEFVLDLSDVAFIDSSGLGTMVRLLTSTRQRHGDLKLCNVPQLVHKTLTLTNLTSLFETHESEESAIAAFYQRKASSHYGGPPRIPVLCIDQNVDVLAYLRELLRSTGYEVHTSSSLRDSLILIRVVKPALLVVGPKLAAAPGARTAFHSASANLPLIELESDFSTQEAGEAASQLLANIRSCLQCSAKNSA